MASNRVKGILQAFQQGEKDSRPTADVPSNCGRIFAKAEDVDGQVEGLFEASIRPCGIPTNIVVDPNRQTTGEPCHVSSPDFKRLSTVHASLIETMAMHRANSLLAILPIALETGFSEFDPKPVPLKVRLQSKGLRIRLRCLELRCGRCD